MLRNSSFVFLCAMAVALLFPGGASYTESFLLPVLGVIMTVSVADISLREFLNVRTLAFPVMAAIVLNYIVLGGTLIGLSRLFVDDEMFRHGYVLMAAVPPAVAVVPLSFLLNGNTRIALIGNVGAYISGLAITPLICLLFLGASLVEPTRLLIVLAELIVLPMVVTRIIRRTPLIGYVEKVRAPVVNWGFFIVIYTIVGLNRDTFLDETDTLLIVVGIAFAGTFVLAEVVNRVMKLFGVDKADRISLMLLSARKNDGLAGVIALIFFGARAAMPIAVFTAISVIHFVWLAWWTKRMR